MTSRAQDEYAEQFVVLDLYYVRVYLRIWHAKYTGLKAQSDFRQDFLEICTPILTLNVSH